MEFFGKAVENLEIKENIYLLNQNFESKGEIEDIISKFKYHPSIITINTKVINSEPFKFNPVTEEEVLEQLTSLDGKKATTFQNIPCKSLKEHAQVCTPFLTKIFNKEVVRNSTFSNKLKYGDIAPHF